MTLMTIPGFIGHLLNQKSSEDGTVYSDIYMVIFAIRLKLNPTHLVIRRRADVWTHPEFLPNSTRILCNPDAVVSR